MPYDVQSPWAAAAGALGGYVDASNKKKRQSVEDQRQARLDAQAQADTQARLGLERSNADATNAYRKAELGNSEERLEIERQNANRAAEATAQALADKQKADAKNKLLETFQGQGLHYPKNWDTMKPEQKIGYLQVRLNAAQKAGDQKTVSNTETEINRVATEAEAARRDAALAKQRDTQNNMGQQRISISLDRLDRPRAGGVPRNAQGLTPEEVIQNAHWDAEHPKGGKKPKATTSDSRETDFSQGLAVIKTHPEHRDEVVRRYAAKYNMTFDKADELFGDQ